MAEMEGHKEAACFDNTCLDIGDEILSDPVIPEELEFNGSGSDYQRRASLAEVIARLKQKPSNQLVYDKGSAPFQSNGSSRVTDPLFLVWQQLSYQVTETKWSVNGLKVTRNAKVKQILKPQSGRAASGTLTAIIGPSGAGKSSLLQCLTGRKGQGVEGEIYVMSLGQGPQKRVSVAFIPQKDYLVTTLTVRESLLFASRVKNCSYNCNHEKVVSEIIKSVNIGSCADLRVSKCSGGQVKRLSFALELVSSPDILVIDEPTTGLDSSTAYQCIKLLRQLTEVGPSPPAIITTVHQPSAKLFGTFHQIYLLSKSGQCLYFGTPNKLTLHFSKIGLRCPSYYNPADFALETASGDYGEKCFEKLNTLTPKTQPIPFSAGLTIATVNRKMANKSFPTLTHMWLLLKRTMLNIAREPMLLWLRLAQHIFVGFMLAFLWSYKIGQEDGCWADSVDVLNSTSIDETKNRLLTKITTITDNTAFLFASSVFLITVSLTTTVLSFPLELKVFLKEKTNGWYNCGTYFVTKFLAEIPIQLLTTFIFCMITYPITGQLLSWWRFMYLFLFSVLLVMVSESMGSLIGTIFVNDMLSAVFMAPGSSVPIFIFGGYFVRLSGMPWFLKPMAYLSYLRYAFEGIILSVYGFGRCSDKSGVNFLDALDSEDGDSLDIVGRIFKSFNNNGAIAAAIGVEPICTEKVFNYTAEYFGLSREDSPVNGTESFQQPSYVLSFFEVEEHLLYVNVCVMLGFVAVFRLVTYFILLQKTNPKA